MSGVSEEEIRMGDRTVSESSSRREAEEVIREGREKLQGVTADPWTIVRCAGEVGGVWSRRDEHEVVVDERGLSSCDAEFIVWARNNLPLILDGLEYYKRVSDNLAAMLVTSAKMVSEEQAETERAWNAHNEAQEKLIRQEQWYAKARAERDTALAAVARVEALAASLEGLHDEDGPLMGAVGPISIRSALRGADDTDVPHRHLNHEGDTEC